LSESAPHRRWAILALPFATRVALGFQFQTMGSVAEPVASDLHLNQTEVGTLIGLFLMPGMVLAIPAGRLGRTLSDRVLVAIGLVAIAGGGLLAAVSTDLETLAAARLVGGMASLALLPLFDWAIPLSLAYGLIGVAPDGLVMALTGQAMAPHKRAFGMGAFLSVFFLGTAPAPGIAGWLYDRTGDAHVPILFAVGLTGAALAGTFAFRAVQRVTR
jgi:predicted MFS family arabinose efflux permease